MFSVLFPDHVKVVISQGNIV